jgi:7-cyano-7-deazaguanine synthase
MDSTQPQVIALLLSGGIDSTALAYLLRPKFAITVDYGQSPAAAEITAASEVCKALGIQHEIIRVDCSAIGAGSMLPLETQSTSAALSAVSPTPEWWPFRNQLIITLAAARAVALSIQELVIGTVKSDREHRDGLPEFVDLMDKLLRLQEGKVMIRAPATEMDSAELVRVSKIPLSLLAWTHSCHRARYSCGSCRGCLKHQRVFSDLEIC